MTGTQLLALITDILGDEAPSQTYLLQLIALAQVYYESKRPWKVLVAIDTSHTVNGSNIYTTPFTIPVDFYRYLGDSSLMEGSIVLFNTGNNQKQILTEVPYERILDYRTEFGKFAVDYKNGNFYICGIVPGTYTIYQYYIATTPAITLNTPWLYFPARFQPILAYWACARWRLGTDYDEIASNNADDNSNMANMLFDSMEAWDAELALSAVNSIDYNNSNPLYLNSNRGQYYLQ